MLDPMTRLANARLVQWVAHAGEGFQSMRTLLVEALPAKEGARLSKQILVVGEAQRVLDEAKADVEQEMDELLGTMARGEILQSLLDSERAAHDFYHSLLDEVRDARLSAMVVGLLREAARRISVVEALRRERP